jgi:rRNA maturation protein Nop10
MFTVLDGLFLFFAIFLIWLAPSWLVAMHAEKKGYSFWGFLLLGFFTSWIIALAIALIVGERPARWATARCPDCAEMILSDARVCKHCGARLDTAEPSPPFPPAPVPSGTEHP